MKVASFADALAESFVSLKDGVLSPSALERNARIQELSFYCKRLSTPQIGFVLNLATSFLEADEAFVNVGVWEGYSFLAAGVDNAALVVGVDDFSEMNLDRGAAVGSPGRRYGPTRDNFYRAFETFGEGNTRFFEQDWASFLEHFAELVPGFSVGSIFYDADHTQESHRRFFHLVEPLLSAECVILVDDLRYPFVREASDEFLLARPNFRRLLEVTVDVPRHPAWWGGFQALARG